MIGMCSRVVSVVVFDVEGFVSDSINGMFELLSPSVYPPLFVVMGCRRSYLPLLYCWNPHWWLIRDTCCWDCCWFIAVLSVSITVFFTTATKQCCFCVWPRREQSIQPINRMCRYIPTVFLVCQKSCLISRCSMAGVLCSVNLTLFVYPPSHTVSFFFLDPFESHLFFFFFFFFFYLVCVFVHVLFFGVFHTIG